MKWFKHSADSHNDPDIADAEDEFGDAGYVVFFKILEIYGREFGSIDSMDFLKISQTFVRRKLRKSWKKVEQILDFYQQRRRIVYKKDKKYVWLKIPKFIEIASNWTRRTTPLPTEVPAEAPAARETEVEEELDLSKDKSAKPPAEAAGADNILPLKVSNPKNKTKHFSCKVGERFKEIKKTCDTILKLPAKNGQIFNPFQWVQQKVIRHNAHPAAISETLQAVKDYWDTTEKPWAYANMVFKTKNGNWHEKEAIRDHDEIKKQWALLVRDSPLHDLVENIANT